MALFVEEDIAFDPFDVGLFGAIGVVFDADDVGDLLEEFFSLAPFGRLRWGGCLFWGIVLHFDLYIAGFYAHYGHDIIISSYFNPSPYKNLINLGD
jgi:hypothetical protein